MASQTNDESHPASSNSSSTSDGRATRSGESDACYFEIVKLVVEKGIDQLSGTVEYTHHITTRPARTSAGTMGIPIAAIAICRKLLGA